ncbi:RDD family protein [Streptomyces tremellae]
MSAPTSAAGDGGPAAGYYPDPSIPGYVRYWNGAAWVPGTSRPAPAGSEAADPRAQAAPQTTSPRAAEETGPVFFDEDPAAGVADGPDAAPVPQEPASAWQADTARQAGFGSEVDRRIAWGAPADPRAASPADPSELSAAPPTGLTAVPPARTAQDADAPEPLPSRAVDDAGRHVGPPRSAKPVDSGAAMRALAAAGRAKEEEAGAAHGPAPAAEAARGELAAPAAPAALPSGRRTAQEQAPRPVPPAGAAPWAQQVHAFAQAPAPAPAAPPVPFATAPAVPAQGGSEPPVVPWKPPKDDPFQAAARAQASARPSGLGRRFLARLIDSVVLGAVACAVAGPLALRARAHLDDKIEAARQSGRTVTVYLLDGTTGAYLAVAVVAVLVFGALYEALPTARWGRTLGKKVCGLRVLDVEAFEPPRLGSALVRWLLYGVLGMVAVGVLNALWCVFDRPWRQCWHDKAARTFVAGPVG